MLAGTIGVAARPGPDALRRGPARGLSPRAGGRRRPRSARRQRAPGLDLPDRDRVRPEAPGGIGRATRSPGQARLRGGRARLGRRSDHRSRGWRPPGAAQRLVTGRASIETRLAAAGLPPLPRTAWLEIDLDALCAATWPRSGPLSRSVSASSPSSRPTPTATGGARRAGARGGRGRRALRRRPSTRPSSCGRAASARRCSCLYPSARRVVERRRCGSTSPSAAGRRTLLGGLARAAAAAGVAAAAPRRSRPARGRDRARARRRRRPRPSVAARRRSRRRRRAGRRLVAPPGRPRRRRGRPARSTGSRRRWPALAEAAGATRRRHLAASARACSAAVPRLRRRPAGPDTYGIVPDELVPATASGRAAPATAAPAGPVAPRPAGPGRRPAGRPRDQLRADVHDRAGRAGSRPCRSATATAGRGRCRTAPRRSSGASACRSSGTWRWTRSWPTSPTCPARRSTVDDEFVLVGRQGGERDPDRRAGASAHHQLVGGR